MVYTYDALFEPAEEGGFVITFPDLPFGVTQGDDEKEGMEMAVDCIETVLGELIKMGEPLPVAKKAPRQKLPGNQTAGSFRSQDRTLPPVSRFWHT